MSNLFYTLIIVTGIIVLFSSLTGDLAKNYGAEDLPEYALFEGVSIEEGDVVDLTDELSESQNVEEQSKFKQWIESGYNLLTDNIIAKAFKSLKIIPKSMGIMLKSVNNGFDDLGLNMGVIKWIIVSLVSISVILILLRAYWEKKI